MFDDSNSSLIGNLDEIDQKILHILQRDGRISNSKLAEEIGLSETPCWRRWKKLEESGLIREYRMIPDRQRFGYSVVSFTLVTLASHDQETSEGFESMVQGLEWVQVCHSITGTIDYMIQMIARDLEEFRERLNVIRQYPGVHTVQTQISVKQIKDTTDIPLA